MLNEKDVKAVCRLLKEKYPNPKSMLNFNSAFELLVAVILSARCTDKRVNIVTGELFKKYNTPAHFVSIEVLELEKLIYSCGFYKNKAANIINASKTILKDYNGQVPNNLENLKKIAGVGNKSANVIYSVYFGGDAIAVDTHVFRVSKRIGLSAGNNVLKVEKDLEKVLPKSEWRNMHHRLIYLGRDVCKRIPKCNGCCLTDICQYAQSLEK